MNSLLWPPDHWLLLLLFKTEKFHFAASWSLRESERSKLLRQQNKLSHQNTIICVGFGSHVSVVLEVGGCSCPPLAGESHLEAKNPYTSGAYFNSTEHWHKALMKAALCLTVWAEGSRRAKGSFSGKRQVERALDPPACPSAVIPRCCSYPPDAPMAYIRSPKTTVCISLPDLCSERFTL